MDRRRKRFLMASRAAVVAATFLAFAPTTPALAGDARPNILFCIADDWGYPHASAYGDPAVATPTFDRLAQEGVLFTHAFTASPSCTPSRSAILTGQWHWRLGSCASNHSTFPDKLTTYVELLERAGYVTGVVGKNWGPGRLETPGRPLAGHPARSFSEFLAQRPKDRPFCFWLGSSDPHRPYELEAARRAASIWRRSPSRSASRMFPAFVRISPTTTLRCSDLTRLSGKPFRSWRTPACSTRRSS